MNTTQQAESIAAELYRFAIVSDDPLIIKTIAAAITRASGEYEGEHCGQCDAFFN